MASFMKQAISYLGLGPDESYAPPAERAALSEAPAADELAEESGHSGVTVVERPMATSTRPGEAAPPSAVRRVAMSSAQPFVMMPRMFDDAQQIGDRFKRDQPVILNLQGLDRDTARRLLDFASGLCYARDGEMRKVANAVYMVVPANVVVSQDEHRSIPAPDVGR
ncbi:cell division protein SepF [Candidatus Poriferisodalis sp.]|uniref:cell division protein SepF n=1 Tax=Candidatus Poriferisodalis sp. TaxID=3101277 RepID=UPI003B02E30B